jgi:hypothetical protein
VIASCSRFDGWNLAGKSGSRRPVPAFGLGDRASISRGSRGSLSQRSARQGAAARSDLPSKTSRRPESTPPAPAEKTVIPPIILYAAPRTPAYRPCQPRCRSQSTLSRRAPCFLVDCSTTRQRRRLGNPALPVLPTWPPAENDGQTLCPATASIRRSPSDFGTWLEWGMVGVWEPGKGSNQNPVLHTVRFGGCWQVVKLAASPWLSGRTSRCASSSSWRSDYMSSTRQEVSGI